MKDVVGSGVCVLSLVAVPVAWDVAVGISVETISVAVGTGEAVDVDWV